MDKVRYLIGIVFCLLMMGVGTVKAEDINVSQQQENVDAKDIVFGHIQDSYEWHITKWGDKDIVIPLPVIVYSKETGWHTFLSSRIAHEGSEYEGLRIATDGDHKGKIVEVNAAGQEIRPFDISITKTVLALLINSVLLVAIILGTARWYKKRTPDSPAPKGFVGFMEMFVMMIEDDVIKGCVGKDYKRYSPFLLTAFFFVFINNLMGLIPIFPGGANVTGNIAITLVLALCTFIAVNVWGNKACAVDAGSRVVRYLHKAFRLDDTFVCQYHGRSLGYLGAHQPDIRNSRHGTCHKRHDDSGIRSVLHLYELCGTAGSLYSGVCVHHAVGSVYRTVPCRRNRERKSIK